MSKCKIVQLSRHDDYRWSGAGDDPMLKHADDLHWSAGSMQYTNTYKNLFVEAAKHKLNNCFSKFIVHVATVTGFHITIYP